MDTDNQSLTELWQQRINDYKASGMTRKAWCELNQVKLHQFQYWWRKFKVADSSSWTTLKLNTGEDSLSSSITLRIGRVEVDIHQGFDQALLSQIIRVASSC